MKTPVNKIVFKTKNPSYTKILDQLIHYPVTKVDPKISQSFSRHKKIRYLSEFDHIYIKKGVISIPRQVKISRKENQFFFEFIP